MEQSKSFSSSTDYEQERQRIIKQKHTLRRYMRLKRNHYVKTHASLITEQWYLDNFVPKIEEILREKENFLQDISER